MRYLAWDRLEQMMETLDVVGARMIRDDPDLKAVSNMKQTVLVPT